MKADLSRSTDQPGKHYRSVRMQQGRVQLDADWNEQQDILNRRIETETRDSIGASGVPIAAPGFLLTGNGQNIDVSAGHLYVDGLLCDNPAACKLVGKRAGLAEELGQPDLHGRISPVLVPGSSLLTLPPAAAVEQTAIRVYDNGVAKAPENGRYLAYLEAWLRHVSALEDGLIREVALGGPDSATRDQLVWQIKLLKVGAVGEAINCLSDIAAWKNLVDAPSGKLAARAEPGTPPKDPCLLTPEAGYQRLENQLYRVEIHEDGVAPAKQRYKWSRDNGAIVTRLTGWLNDPAADEIEVASIGRDAYLGISAGCWLEIFNDEHEQTGRSGPLVPVIKTEGNRVTLDLDNATETPTAGLFAHNPRVRRWDGVALLETVNANAGANVGWSELEDGVEVRFLAGTFRVGDFWTIPARTATAGIEWPQESGKSQFVTPQGVLRAFTRLALLDCQAGSWTRISDCRAKFPALTELTNLYYVGGDGQQVMPSPSGSVRVKLPSALQVAVYNGQFPVAGAEVRFTAPKGLLQNGTAQAVATTNDQGIASVEWFLSSAVADLDQTCTAELLLAGTAPVGRFNDIHFSARLAIANQVAYDPANCADMKAAGISTVQAALDALCQRNHQGGCCISVGKDGEFPTLDRALQMLLKKGERDICLCLLPGDHALDELVVEGANETNLMVHGAGPASRLQIKAQAFALSKFAAVSLRDFDILCEDSMPCVISLRGIDRLDLRDMLIEGLSEPGASLLQIHECAQVALSSLRLRAGQPNVTGGPLKQPGFALLLADAQGDIRLNDSEVSGRISVYGESVSSDMLNVDVLKRLSGLKLKGRGRLYLSNNQLGELRLADDVLAELSTFSGDSQPKLPSVFQRVIANDNALPRPPLQLLAVQVALHQNSLQPAHGQAGMVIAEEGKYICNFCRVEARLLTSGHSPEQSCNGALQVV